MRPGCGERVYICSPAEMCFESPDSRGPDRPSEEASIDSVETASFWFLPKIFYS